MRLAINGMGRIGRLLCKLLAGKGHTIVAVNDIMERENLFYLMRYDTIYGTHFSNRFIFEDQPGGIGINGEEIKVLKCATLETLPWKDLDIDLVIECTGRYLDREALAGHLHAGAKKVLLSTTGSPDIPLFIRGFNDKKISHSDELLSSGGCMTNCSTLLIDELVRKFELKTAHINVIHSYTSRQSLVDGPHRDLRRGRASGTSIIPVDSDLASTLDLLFPSLAGNITTTSTRVPIECGALLDLHGTVAKDASASEINKAFKELADKKLRGVLAVNEDPIVSRDILANKNSAILDATLTRSVGNHIKISAWFDDQFGFTTRLTEIIEEIAR